MLEPQEKAEELYFKYSMKGLEEIKSILNRVVRKNIAKQCALIAVDEVLDSLEENMWQNRLMINYYEEVRNEIENL
jgi:hypothetical protein